MIDKNLSLIAQKTQEHKETQENLQTLPTALFEEYAKFFGTSLSSPSYFSLNSFVTREIFKYIASCIFWRLNSNDLVSLYQLRSSGQWVYTFKHDILTSNSSPRILYPQNLRIYLLEACLFQFSAQENFFPSNFYQKSIGKQDIYGPITIQGNNSKSRLLPDSVLGVFSNFNVGIFYSGSRSISEMREDHLPTEKEKIVNPNKIYYIAKKVLVESSITNQIVYENPNGVDPNVSPNSILALSPPRQRVSESGYAITFGTNTGGLVWYSSGIKRSSNTGTWTLPTTNLSTNITHPLTVIINDIISLLAYPAPSWRQRLLGNYPYPDKPSDLPQTTLIGKWINLIQLSDTFYSQEIKKAIAEFFPTIPESVRLRFAPLVEAIQNTPDTTWSDLEVFNSPYIDDPETEKISFQKVIDFLFHAVRYNTVQLNSSFGVNSYESFVEKVLSGIAWNSLSLPNNRMPGEWVFNAFSRIYSPILKKITEFWDNSINTLFHRKKSLIKRLVESFYLKSDIEQELQTLVSKTSQDFLSLGKSGIALSEISDVRGRIKITQSPISKNPNHKDFTISLDFTTKEPPTYIEIHRKRVSNLKDIDFNPGPGTRVKTLNPGEPFEEKFSYPYSDLMEPPYPKSIYSYKVVSYLVSPVFGTIRSETAKYLSTERRIRFLRQKNPKLQDPFFGVIRKDNAVLGQGFVPRSMAKLVMKNTPILFVTPGDQINIYVVDQRTLEPDGRVSVILKPFLGIPLLEFNRLEYKAFSIPSLILIP